MVINFRVYEINQDTHKLTRTRLEKKIYVIIKLK